jgi:hypothetical protein
MLLTPLDFERDPACWFIPGGIAGAAKNATPASCKDSEFREAAMANDRKPSTRVSVPRWLQTSCNHAKWMSALGQERSFRPGQPNVRFAPEADIQAWGD